MPKIIPMLVVGAALLCFTAAGRTEVPADIRMEDPEHPLVKMTTDRGDIYLELFPEIAPLHVDNFLNLIKAGFYNGLIFHRVVPGQIIQGGCPDGTGRGGPGYTIPAEFNFRKHKKGTLSMARSSHPDSAGSQFYICLKRMIQLDGKYTVFGQVVKGRNVPARIKKSDRMRTVEVLQDF